MIVERLQIAIFAMMLLLSAAAGSAADLFPDKALENAVREQVFAKRDNTEPLTAEDVAKVSVVIAEELGVKSLKGLEACLALAELRLSGNEITDLSPLANLQRLQSLDISKNKVADVSPLANLKRLQYLNAEQNEIEILGALEGLENLNSLYLGGNKISDLTPLAKLRKVWSLLLDDNQITDLKPIAEMTWLTALGLRNNQVEDLTPLRELEIEHFLFLEGNKIRDLGVLVEMAERDFAKDRRFSPFWRIYLARNPLDEQSIAPQLERFKACGSRIYLVDPKKEKANDGTNQGDEKGGESE